MAPLPATRSRTIQACGCQRNIDDRSAHHDCRQIREAHQRHRHGTIVNQGTIIADDAAGTISIGNSAARLATKDRCRLTAARFAPSGRSALTEAAHSRPIGPVRSRSAENSRAAARHSHRRLRRASSRSTAASSCGESTIARSDESGCRGTRPRDSSTTLSTARSMSSRPTSSWSINSTTHPEAKTPSMSIHYLSWTPFRPSISTAFTSMLGRCKSAASIGHQRHDHAASRWRGDRRQLALARRDQPGRQSRHLDVFRPSR